ncbi:MAG: hypothetical protein ABI867_40350 [Kofleriaceae bacterium]
MPSSDLAYKAMYAALDARGRTITRAAPDVAQLHEDVFVETSGPTSSIVYMFIVRSTTTVTVPPQLYRYGVFANVDKRAAAPPRIDPIVPDDCELFLESLQPIALVTDGAVEPAAGGVTFEVRIRNQHADITMHFANPRPPREDLLELGRAIRSLVTLQTS